MSRKLVVILIVVVNIFWQCKTSQVSISNKDVSNIYNPMSTAIHPEFNIYHNSDTTSLLFFKIRTFELLYRANEETGKNKAAVRIFYKLYASLDSKEILDSATTVLNINKSSRNYLISYIPLKTQLGKNYSLEIQTTDLIRNTINQHVLEINKSSFSSNQFFIFTDKRLNQPVFKKFTKDTLEININNKISENSKFSIEVFSQNFSPAMPPFYSQNIELDIPEPTNKYEFESIKDIDFTISDPGLYLFSLENNDSLKTTINYFDNYYPEFKTPEQLLEPLIYLNSSKEFKKMALYEKPKFAVDSFWLNTTGNVERAKELIRIYYNRAQLANYYFTSYKEGWKTDRGMIYLVLGMPTTIFKTSTSEIWTYGKSATYKTMEFTFIKKHHPFCKDYFVLDRSEIYDRLWYQAVDTWRNGRAFSVMN
jgi:GWxTD domain-containing protein